MRAIPMSCEKPCSLRSHTDVAIGAHPGFPDLAGFGRRAMPLTPREVEDVVVYQIGALSGMVRACGGAIRHVKPHGALYNLAADDVAIAEAIARATAAIDPGLTLLGLAGSASIEAARNAGLATASEAFADRTYESNGRLSTSRWARTPTSTARSSARTSAAATRPSPGWSARRSARSATWRSPVRASASGTRGRLACGS